MRSFTFWPRRLPLLPGGRPGRRPTTIVMWLVRLRIRNAALGRGRNRFMVVPFHVGGRVPRDPCSSRGCSSAPVVGGVGDGALGTLPTGSDAACGHTARLPVPLQQAGPRNQVHHSAGLHGRHADVPAPGPASIAFSSLLVLRCGPPWQLAAACLVVRMCPLERRVGRTRNLWPIMFR